MASPDLRDMLSKLCIDVRDEARFNCNKEWEIKSVVGFCHDSGEQKYKIAWQDSVLSKTDLMCSLVNDEWPLYRFARHITPEGSGSQLRVAWEETWEPANAIFAAAELIHEYWLGVYQSREPLSGQLVHQHWVTLHEQTRLDCTSPCSSIGQAGMCTMSAGNGVECVWPCEDAISLSTVDSE